MTSPTSPEPFRRETGWVYSQGAPPVFKGDLVYYLGERDLTDDAKDIDPVKFKGYLLPILEKVAGG